MGKLCQRGYRKNGGLFFEVGDRPNSYSEFVLFRILQLNYLLLSSIMALSSDDQKVGQIFQAAQPLSSCRMYYFRIYHNKYIYDYDCRIKHRNAATAISVGPIPATLKISICMYPFFLIVSQIILLTLNKQSGVLIHREE